MKPMTKEELYEAWEFNLTNHKPTEEGIVKIESNRNAAIVYAKTLIHNCPTSRDLSLALTAVEESLFHANAAIARTETEDLNEA